MQGGQFPRRSSELSITECRNQWQICGHPQPGADKMKIPFSYSSGSIRASGPEAPIARLVGVGQRRALDGRSEPRVMSLPDCTERQTSMSRKPSRHMSWAKAMARNCSAQFESSNNSTVAVVRHEARQRRPGLRACQLRKVSLQTARRPWVRICGISKVRDPSRLEDHQA